MFNCNVLVCRTCPPVDLDITLLSKCCLERLQLGYCSFRAGAGSFMSSSFWMQKELVVTNTLELSVCHQFHATLFCSLLLHELHEQRIKVHFNYQVFLFPTCTITIIQVGNNPLVAGNFIWEQRKVFNLRHLSLYFEFFKYFCRQTTFLREEYPKLVAQC